MSLQGVTAAVLVVASIVGPTIGATITLGAAADNTLYEDPAGGISNGAGQYLFAGMTAQGVRRRGLIRFDVASALPADATVQSVTLTMHLSRTSTGTEAVSLNRLLSDWGEGASDGLGDEGAGAPAEQGDATWLYREWDTSMWMMPGGDFDASATAATLVASPGTYSWSSAAMAVEVQSWLSTPLMNSGWMIIGNEAAVQTAKRFDSRENDDPALRPALHIVYFPAPTSALLSAAAMIWMIRRKRSAH